MAQDFYFGLNIVQSFVINVPTMGNVRSCLPLVQTFLSALAVEKNSIEIKFCSCRNKFCANHGQNSKLVSSKSNVVCMHQIRSSKTNECALSAQGIHFKTMLQLPFKTSKLMYFFWNIHVRQAICGHISYLS